MKVRTVGLKSEMYIVANTYIVKHILYMPRSELISPSDTCYDLRKE